jgi:hypothetical protein
MAPISARPCLSPARRSTGSPCAAPRGRSKGGKRIPMGPMISPSSRSTGSSGRPAVRRARSRPAGGSIAIARASRIPSSASASRIAAPVRPGRGARGRRRRGAACISRRRSVLKPSKRPGPGMRVRRGGNATNVGRGGGEGTLSQGVRAFGLRRTRFRGVAKTHFQHVAIAAAINIDRIVAWLDERPRAKTRTSRFAALAPVCPLPSGTLPGADLCCPPGSCDGIAGS